MSSMSRPEWQQTMLERTSPQWGNTELNSTYCWPRRWAGHTGGPTCYLGTLQVKRPTHLDVQG